MLCGEYLYSKFGGDVARIPAQLLSGIGFIGAGTILTDGFNVKGLTTAASLLSVTCIGLSIGAGFYLGGIVCTLVIYLILAYSHKTLNKFEHSRNVRFNIYAKNSETLLEKIQIILDNYKFNIKKIKSNNVDNKKEIQLSIICKYKNETNINTVINEIANIENIIEIEEEE